MLSSLASYVSYLRVLPELSIQPPTVIPDVCVCPICRATHAYVYHDSISGGEWLHCRRCRFGGDMIETAARAWNLEIPAAIQELTARQLWATQPQEADKKWYIQKLQPARQAIAAFWSAANKQLWTAPAEELQPVRESLSLTSTHATRSHLTAAFGETPVAELQQLLREFGSCGQSPQDTKRVTQPGELRRVYTNVLIVGFSDLPGRLCGVLCLQPNSPPVYRRFWSTREAGTEAGVALLSTLLNNEAFWKGRVLLARGTCALRLQLQHLETYASPLPVAMFWHDKFSTSSYPWLTATQKPVFWATASDIGCLAQAAATDGYVADREASSLVPSAAAIGRSVLQVARHWSDCLREQLLLPAIDATALLLAVPLRPGQLAELAAVWPPDAIQRLSAATTGRTVKFCGQKISETTRGWEYPDGQIVSSAILRIDTVWFSTDCDSYYEGRLLVDHERIPFCVLAKTLDTEGFRWVQATVRDTLGELVQVDPRRLSHAVLLAGQFQRPQRQPLVAAAGWVSAKTGFAWETGSFYDGDVIGSPRCLRHPQPLPTDLATWTLDELEYWQSHPRSGKLWLLLAAILQPLLAAVYGAVPQGLFLAGDLTAGLLAWCRGCGCPDVVTPGWLTTQPRFGAAGQLASGTPLQGAAAVQQGQNCLTWPGPWPAASAAELELCRAVPRFLLWYSNVAGRKPTTTLTISDVLQLLQDWFSGDGGDPAAVLRDSVALTLPGTSTVDIARLLLTAAAAGQLPGADTEADATSRSNVIWGPRECWVKHAVFAAAVMTSSGICLTTNEIIAAFKWLPAYRGPHTRYGQLGYRLDAAWWADSILDIQTGLKNWELGVSSQSNLPRNS